MDAIVTETDSLEITGTSKGERKAYKNLEGGKEGLQKFG